MSKRILLAEESETIKKIAETLLRKNGFEVLSMETGKKALEVLKFTSPDLILLATDMKFNTDTSLFDKLQSDPKTSQIPIVLLATVTDNDLPLPSEAVIQKPFKPKEFLEKVNLFSGNTQETPINPLGSNDVEDEFLDAALGLDNIDVTDSEVLDQNKTGQIRSSKPKAQKTAEYVPNQVATDSGKVESLMITDDDVTDIKHTHQKPISIQDSAATGGLDLLDDQFGMVGKGIDQLTNENADHDYNWFLDELANEEAQPEQSSQGLKFTDNSSTVDPITPATSQKKSETTTVDKFIDEFKKEVEKIGSDETESITINEPEQVLSKSGSVLHWTDSIEKISPQQIELFKKEFVAELADKLAVQIANKIDAKKLLQLLKQEIINKVKKL